MTTYKYLGWGTTDENGVAHLDHDANGDEIQHSYTGVGAGEVDVVASLDNPVSSGSIVSVPCNVLDALFYCKGTIGNVNANWVAETGITSTPDTEGNLLENSTSGGKYYGANLVNTSTGELKDYTTPFVIEFDCISTTGARLFINTSTGGSNIDRNFTSYITGNNHIKMIVRSNDYDLIVDGDSKVSQQSHSLVNPVGVRLVVQANSNLKYKDFEIYPI